MVRRALHAADVVDDSRSALGDGRGCCRGMEVGRAQRGTACGAIGVDL